jgi:hypothetical protein
MVLFAILACSRVLLLKLATSLLGVDVVVIGILEKRNENQFKYSSVVTMYSITRLITRFRYQIHSCRHGLFSDL